MKEQVPQVCSVRVPQGGAEHEQEKYTCCFMLAHKWSNIHWKYVNILLSIYITTVSYVLSELKHLGKKSNRPTCHYIRSVHSVLKRQQPNYPPAVCVINVNHTTKEKENHSLLLTKSLYNFNKNQCILLLVLMTILRTDCLMWYCVF